MGCGSSMPGEYSDELMEPRPESDVDVASVKDFEQEQQEAALRISREPSDASRSSCRSQAGGDCCTGDDLPQPEATDQISLQSIQGELPPLCPPRRCKEHLIPRPSIFHDIERHVKHTPKSATNSVTSLAFYLTSPSPTDLHSVRAIFLWLTLNITYDSASYLSGTVGPQDPGSVLICRKAICVGFALFCEVLCSLSGVPCLTVQGIAKGYSHDPETVHRPDDLINNHVWNLVLVQGEWRPLDCAWGAGFLKDDGTFQQELNDHWFLTDPAEFLPTHFPYMYKDAWGSRKYQLLHHTVDLAAFCSMVRLDQLAFRVGLKLLTHRRAVLDDVVGDVTIRVKATKRLLRAVTAYVTEKKDKTKRKNSFPMPEVFSSRSVVLTSRDNDDTWRIYIRPPRVTTYTLTIMGQAEEDGQTTLQRLCVYAVCCRKAEPTTAHFPDIRGSWGLQFPMATECGLRKVKAMTFQYEANDGVTSVPIALCRHTEVAVKLRHADKMDDDLVRYTFIEYKNDGDVNIQVRLPRPGYFLLRAFAAHPRLSGLQHVADYLLHADSPCYDCLPFPLSSDFAHANHTRLLQPRVRKVSSGVAWIFRVQAPGLNRMHVNDRQMTRRSDGTWEAQVCFDQDEKTVVICGTVEKESCQLSGLYTFDVV